ncbi:CYTH domain-containing protein [Alteribacter keqinensis]|uniref:CYTH domain-containing protein n=1 Tax=Alteribacter keqinensis TaxID=2483800 RepID=A0A3M7TW97_9BACI|nr:CYTH domain-containing protein [Alteribacter keqinensis]RNA69887.1 CYTH domain-containing protein [Alteribacter keqinensis]
MNQEIEIEFKNLLTEEEYKNLRNAYFTAEEAPFSQTNHYFDTPDFLLKQHGSALRIRKKKDRFVLTLKQPLESGLLETHQTLTTDQADAALTISILPSGDVLEQIQKTLEVQQTSFAYLGSLSTDRLEKEVDGGLLVLDKSTYINVTDYELEFECAEESAGKKAFFSLLEKHGIKEKQTISKIHRFYEQLHKL